MGELRCRSMFISALETTDLCSLIFRLWKTLILVASRIDQLLILMLHTLKQAAVGTAQFSSLHNHGRKLVRNHNKTIILVTEWYL